MQKDTEPANLHQSKIAKEHPARGSSCLLAASKRPNEIHDNKMLI